MRMTYGKFFGKCACILAAAAVLWGTAGASALEFIDDEEMGHYVVDGGKVYTPVYNEDGFTDHYLDEQGNKSCMSDEGFMYTPKPYPNDGSHPEIQQGSYEGYALTVNSELSPYFTGWDTEKISGGADGFVCVSWKPPEYFYDFSGAVIRIPDSIRVDHKKDIKGIDGRIRRAYTKSHLTVGGNKGQLRFQGI